MQNKNQNFSQIPVFPHQLTKNVKLLQKVVLQFENKILILQRSENAKTRPLCFDLPGGNSEWPSDQKENQKENKENKENLHYDDLSREIFEETGLKINCNNLNLNNLIFFKTFFEAEKQVYSIIIGWKIILDNQQKNLDNQQKNLDNQQKNLDVNLNNFNLNNVNSNKVKLSNEHIDYKWIDINQLVNQLDDFDFGGKSGEFIKSMIRASFE